MNSSPSLSESEQLRLIKKLGIFQVQGRDRQGHKVLLIIGKFFPGGVISGEMVNKYLEEKVFPKLGEEKPFSVVYLNTDVKRGENFPGISALRSIYEGIPVDLKNRIQAVYFLHPGFQARLFLATFGRFIFSGGLYSKLKYVNRVEFLWDHVRRNEVELPEFVYDHDEEMECRPIVDYGLESDFSRLYCGASVDNPVSTYSMRCIA